MPIRTGIDVTNVDRVRRTLEAFRDRFHEKYFNELNDPDGSAPDLTAETYAGLWAAKEAAFKAIGRGYRWEGVNIQYEESGRPILTVDYDEARLGPSPIPRGADWDCSIAHDAGMAIAFAVCYWAESDA